MCYYYLSYLIKETTRPRANCNTPTAAACPQIKAAGWNVSHGCLCFLWADRRGELIPLFGAAHDYLYPPEHRTCIITHWPVQTRKTGCSIDVSVRFTVSTAGFVSLSGPQCVSQFVHDIWQQLHPPHPPARNDTAAPLCCGQEVDEKLDWWLLTGHLLYI